MAVPESLLELLVCPRCRGALEVPAGEEGLVCARCGLCYPVRDGIPVLIDGEALPWPPR